MCIKQTAKEIASMPPKYETKHVQPFTLHVYKGEENLGLKHCAKSSKKMNVLALCVLFLPETNRLLYCKRKLGYELIIGLVWRHIDTIETNVLTPDLWARRELPSMCFGKLTYISSFLDGESTWSVTAL